LLEIKDKDGSKTAFWVNNQTHAAKLTEQNIVLQGKKIKYVEKLRE
jgi:hypothetical protein